MGTCIGVVRCLDTLLNFFYQVIKEPAELQSEELHFLRPGPQKLSLFPSLISGGLAWQHTDAVELISVLKSDLNSNVFSSLQCISFTAGTYHYLVKLYVFYCCYLQN